MRTTINHALDILEKDEYATCLERAQNSDELLRVLKRVQTDYVETIETALSLLVQDKDNECQIYLKNERAKLEATKERIANLLIDEERWTTPLHRLSIEYLFTRARLVDEIRLFPHFSLELLDRLTLDQSLTQTITYLEEAMTGKRDLFIAIQEIIAGNS